MDEGSRRCSNRSHFIGQVTVLPCEHVTIGTDCSDVVLVTRGEEREAVGEDLMAGNSVGLSSLLMITAKVAFPQSLQHLGADLQRGHTSVVSLSQQRRREAVVTNLDASSRQGLIQSCRDLKGHLLRGRLQVDHHLRSCKDTAQQFAHDNLDTYKNRCTEL